MTTAELQSMLEADFLGFDALETLLYTDKATAGDSVYNITSARKTFQIVKQFGEANVKGYQIDKVQVTFPYDNFTHTPKLGDTFVLNAANYEVTEVANKSAYTRWLVTGERAFIETDWAATIDIQRATLSVNSAGAQVETYADTTTGVSCIVMLEDDVSDVLARLAVRGDMQSISFFVAQTVTVGPMDRIEYGSRFYRINSIMDEGRVARLKRIRCQIYA